MEEDSRSSKGQEDEDACYNGREREEVRGNLVVHYGTKPGHFETSKIHFPTSEGVSKVSERAN